MRFSAEDDQYMAKALRLARRGLYTTHPNPRVGCVIVAEGMVIGEGWHSYAGGRHAEINALRSAKNYHPQLIVGSTVYVTLEPCCHQGKTGPCVAALVEAGIKRVVVAMTDPNPQVAGKGLQQLADAGIDVAVGIMEAEATKLNPGFIKRMRHQRPYIRLKLAASLDGKTALNSGESRWISSKASRDDVQRWRARSSAIMTGIGTVLADDPALNVRLETDGAIKPGEIRQPLRIVLDGALRIPEDATILKLPGEVLIVTLQDDNKKADAIRSEKVEIIRLPADSKLYTDLTALMSVLCQGQVNELLVECGSTLAARLLETALVDELILYIAPYIIGNHAKGLFALPELAVMQDRIGVDIQDVRQIGSDIRIIARPVYQ